MCAFPHRKLVPKCTEFFLKPAGFQEGARKIKPVILNMLGQGDLRWSPEQRAKRFMKACSFRVGLSGDLLAGSIGVADCVAFDEFDDHSENFELLGELPGDVDGDSA